MILVFGAALIVLYPKVLPNRNFSPKKKRIINISIGFYPNTRYS